ncbi:enoyl-CoA hydratase/isomerase [Caballeronia terrestris]|uniref:3-hydroxyisobutyryl-CoA hydrolase n=1 Tax=Caballeronia terrestris TaxID=1226301 RepID=A0A158IFE6_9BURK|nr:enoyl-CoA hydratase/isomerase family protein [Caballeronia terrestris]SAL54821.1 enoyl-CoA hydratase/isomerase [Caballeronia terrestris]
MSTQSVAQDEPVIGFEIVNRVAIVTLNRPRALNALSHEMIVLLADAFERCRNDDAIAAVVLRGAGEKAFCAGGDIRALYDGARSNTPWLPFFIDEYRLDYAIHHFPKPVVALMDGIVLGGGMGLAQGAALRVVTERTKMAMPETRIGMLPDVGATYFMRRMPLDVELYAGLTGAMLGGADAVAYGLADVCVPSAWLRDFMQRIEALSWDKPLDALRRVFVPPANIERDAPLDAHRAQIRRHFGGATSGGVERIVSSLAGDTSTEFGAATLATLTSHSPTMLEVTHRALLRGRHMSLADCFRMEMGIVYRAISDGDFLEGVRALIVDKDQRPRWAPATLAEVRAERVQHFLASPWRREMHPLADLGAAIS